MSEVQPREEAGAAGAMAGLRGSNQAGLRAHNERAVLSLIRRHGELAKAEIARLTGLSPQTASVIMRALEGDRLVLRAEPRRGRVGQPSVPMRLNPDGAFSFGLKIGRRSLDLVLMDFVGQVRGREREAIPYPTPERVVAFTGRAVARLRDGLDADGAGRIAGLGVGMPFQLWDWARECGAPPGAMEGWRDFDTAEALKEIAGLPVFVANDGTAACGAEHVFGRTEAEDFAYLFVASFIGGGVVVGGHLVSGRGGNAGALGSVPVPGAGGGAEQLINVASLHLLERAAAEAGVAPGALREPGFDWTGLGPLLDAWLDEAARGIAYAAAAASSVFDFESLVIDGAFPPAVRERLVAATRAAMEGVDRQGLSPLAVEAGSIGAEAREIGAASLPFFAKFLLDHRVLLAERA